MSIKLPLVIAILAIALVAPINAQAITVDPFTNASDLVNNILGSGITASNITYSGATAASGFFKNGNTVPLGINSGILLTSGYASNVGNTNISDGITGDNNLAGDADLNNLGYSTHDATSLQFDFVSKGGDLYFNYVFGSDEYNEYTNSSYNDVFAFFLDGQNIALIPGTSTPVSINNVNGGNPFGSNASNSQYFNNNDLSDGGQYPFEYDGFTDVFTAQVLGLSAGTHTIKLAIADAGDHVLDSGVFIQGGSFSDVPTDPGGVVPEPATMMLLGSGLLSMFGLRRQQA